MSPDTCTGVIVGLLRLGSPAVPLSADHIAGDEDGSGCEGFRVQLDGHATVAEINDRCAVIAGHTRDPLGPEWSCLRVEHIALDWSDPTALLHAALYLESKGHPSAWMLPEGMLGGKTPAHAGMAAHEVSAVLLARSVRRVAAGMGPIRHLLDQWGVELLSGSDGPVQWPTRWVIGGARRIGSPRLLMVGPTCWYYDAEVLRPDASTQAVRYVQGPETGEEGRKAADAAALADGCAPLTADGILLPPLPVPG